MKRAVIFFAAAAVAALPVIGQDSPDGKLKDRIDALLAELDAHARAAQAEPAKEPVVVRHYDVSDLTAWRRDEGEQLNQLYRSKGMREEPDGPEPREVLEIDSLVELLRQIVYPASWDTIEGADMMARDSTLVVGTTARVHAEIARRIRDLRSTFIREATVEIVAVEADLAMLRKLDEHPHVLPAALAAEWLGRETLGALRLGCPVGQRMFRRHGKTASYLASYDVSVAEAAVVGRPIRHEIFEGCAALVSVHLVGTGAIVDLTLERTEVDTTSRLEWEHGPIDAPRVVSTRGGGSAFLPDGATVAFAGGAGDHGSCVFLVTIKKGS